MASQDRIRTAERNIASATRVLDAIKARKNAGTGTDLDVAQQESVLANQTAAVPPLRQTLDQNINALAMLVVAAAGKPARRRRFDGSDCDATGDARPAVGTVDAAAGYQAPGGATGFRHRQCRQRPRAVLSEHPVDRAGRLSELGADIAVPASRGVLQPGRRPDPADLRRRRRSSAISKYAKAKQDELLQTYRKTVVSAFTDVDNALVSIRQTTDKLRLQREVVAASRRAFQLSEQQLRAGTADIVTVLNTQLTLFQAEDALWQAQLARLLAVVSLYQALGGGWEPRMEKPVDAL